MIHTILTFENPFWYNKIAKNTKQVGTPDPQDPPDRLNQIWGSGDFLTISQ